MKSMDLDTTRQQDLYARACQDMAECIPGWNDAYPSDPAVAVLEYLTYLSDIQNYTLNQMQDRHYQAFLSLLGQQCATAKPAVVMAQANGDLPCYPGESFCVGDITFEVSDAPCGRLPHIVSICCENAAGESVCPDGAMQLPGGKDGVLHITLDDTLPAGERCAVWFVVSPEPGRNPLAEDTPAPVQFYLPGEKGQCLCADTTCGLLRTGAITFTPHKPLREICLQVRGRWEGKPRLAAVTLQPVFLRQQQTRSIQQELTAPFRLPQGWAGKRVLHYFTPKGTGWEKQPAFYEEQGCIAGWKGQSPKKIRVVACQPDFAAEAALNGISMERVLLEETQLCPESLQVMVEQDGLWYDCPVTEPDPEKTLPIGCRWDQKNSVLRFGDGRDFQILRPGQVLISSCMITCGSKGNDIRGTLTGESGQLTAYLPSAGGCDTETPRTAFQRAAKEQETLCRAVTCQDYEQLSRKTPGLALDRVRAVPRKVLGSDGPGVVVLAKPKSEEKQPTLTAWQHRQLQAQMDAVRMLGVPVEVRRARYCPLRVRVSLLVSQPIPAEQLRQAILPLTDGVEGTLDFGQEVSYTTLYATLGRIPHVRSVLRLELIPLVSGTKRGRDGSVYPAPDMLPCLAEFEVMT